MRFAVSTAFESEAPLESESVDSLSSDPPLDSPDDPEEEEDEEEASRSFRDRLLLFFRRLLFVSSLSRLRFLLFRSSLRFLSLRFLGFFSRSSRFFGFLALFSEPRDPASASRSDSR